MEIKLTPQESEEYFYTALCNGLGYTTSGYGLSLDYSDEEYGEAKEKLSRESPGKFISFEDVLLEMLKMGYNLIVIDEEGEGDNNSVISIQDVHERVSNVPARHLLAMMNEDDDADTADAILQQVFFNDIIFG